MREYVMQGPGGPYTCLLSDRDAERFGAVPVETAATIESKQKTPKNKQAAAEKK